MATNPNKAKRYIETFKNQIVDLIESGKPIKDIAVDYNIARSTVSKWYKDFTSLGSFKAQDNKNPKEKEIKRLKKELAHARMEIDILKRAALIMGRK